MRDTTRRGWFDQMAAALVGACVVKAQSANPVDLATPRPPDGQPVRFTDVYLGGVSPDDGQFVFWPDGTFTFEPRK